MEKTVSFFRQQNFVWSVSDQNFGFLDQIPFNFSPSLFPFPLHPAQFPYGPVYVCTVLALLLFPQTELMDKDGGGEAN